MLHSDRFRYEAPSYPISGGVGGVGQNIARARNLILLFSSSVQNEAMVRLLKESRADGVHVEACACDRHQADSLRVVLTECVQSMPSIKDCVQGINSCPGRFSLATLRVVRYALTVCTKDAVFETMSLERPKLP